MVQVKKDINHVSDVLDDITTNNNYDSLLFWFDKADVALLKNHLEIIEGTDDIAYHVLYGEVVMTIDMGGYVYFTTLTDNFQSTSVDGKAMMGAHINYDDLDMLHRIWLSI